MPVLVPVVAAVAAAAATSALTATLGTLLATAVGAVIAGGLNFTASRLFAKKPSTPSLTNDAGVQQEMVRSAVDSHKIIYGQARVGGTIVFAGSTNSVHDSSDSGTNAFLHLVIALAGHQVDEIGQIYIDDTPVDVNVDGYVTTAPYQKTTSVPITATAEIVTANIASQVMTLTTTLPHGLSAGEAVTIDGAPSLVTGTFKILAVPTSTTFTVSRPGYKDQTLSSVDAEATAPRTQTTVSSYIKVNKHLGSATQTADTDLITDVPGWTVNHRLHGIAYIVVRLQFNADIFIHGIPTINALVKGKQCYDPRSATTAWTTNAALCSRDYLSSAYGFNVPDARINDSYVIAAANVSDESVTTADGSTQARYTCNGVLDTQYIPLDNLQQLVSALAGTVVFVQGQFRIHAAAYDAPEASFSLDTSPSPLAGSVQIQTRPSRQDLFNAVRGVFVNPAQDYQATDFPPVTNATYEAQDGGTRIYKDIQLPFTNDVEAAQRIAKVILEKARQGITVTFPASYAALKLAPMSIITLSNAATGWSSKVFRVMKFGFSMKQGVTVTLQEESSESYDWNAGEATIIDPAPDTNLPDALLVTPPGAPSVTEALYTTRNSAGVKSRASVSWSPILDAFVSEYQAEYRVANTDPWFVLPRTTDSSINIDDVTAGTYDFRVKAINTFGVSSDYVYTLGVNILGLSAPPADIATFNVIAGQDVAHLSWDAVGDLDVIIGGNIVIRHTPDTVSPSWGSGLEIARFPGNAATGTAQLLDGTYMAKAVDSTGNWSVNATLVETNLASMIVLNEVATLDYGPAFGGVKIGTAVVNGKLQLASSLTIGLMPGNVSTWPRMSALGGYAASGIYFPPSAGLIDLGDVYACTVSAALDAEAFDNADFISARSNNISNWPSITGGVVNDITAQIFLRSTTDDPAGTPTWTDYQHFVSGSFTARAFQSYLQITHNGFGGDASPTTNLAVSDLAMTVKMPNRTEGANSIIVATIGATISFADAFKVTPIIAITGLNMTSGDYWTISAQTASSFFIQFFNSSNVGVQRTMNWAAHGYGKQGG